MGWQQLSLTLAQGGAGRTVRYADGDGVAAAHPGGFLARDLLNGGAQVMTTRYYPDPACRAGW